MSIADIAHRKCSSCALDMNVSASVAIGEQRYEERRTYTCPTCDDVITQTRDTPHGSWKDEARGQEPLPWWHHVLGWSLVAAVIILLFWISGGNPLVLLE